MKLKMSDRSLFALLLRSPWWVSFIIVAVISLLFKLALPQASFAFGILSGLPFIIIGCIAAWRQLQAPSAKRIDAIVEALNGASWRDLSTALEQAWRADGYAVSRLEHPGADFLLEKAGRRSVVACKRWKAGSHGVEPLRQLLAAADTHDAFERSYIALSALNDNARRFAADNRITLMQAPELARLLRGMPLPR